MIHRADSVIADGMTPPSTRGLTEFGEVVLKVYRFDQKNSLQLYKKYMTKQMSFFILE